NAQSLEVAAVGSSHPLTTTGPISPQANDEVTLDLSPGDYTVAIGPGGGSQAAAATPTGIQPGSLTVQGGRGSSNNQLLQP
ncbi:MAG TPA: hypothetical protein VE983_05845, partial [Solirubrobacteraceae bacterium]|nr:hypothetical protein [Solirubrobacteraceae bacterium]